METRDSLITEETGIELLYRQRSIQNVGFKDVEQYNKYCKELGLPPIQDSIEYNKEFTIPEKYKNIDVESFVRGLIPDVAKDNAEVSARVDMELSLFKAKNLYPILQLMIYIIDVMRKNNLVWGVGRGSSVASYVLYLIGVHKIDSIKYGLDIKEFLKE